MRGKKPSVGHTVSHSNIKTLRRFEPNLQKRRLFNPATGGDGKCENLYAVFKDDGESGYLIG